MPATVPATAPVSVLPDCCNLGVILRTLVAVNGAVMVAILFAVGLKILRTADTNLPGVIVSWIVCVLMLRTRISPLWFMAVAGVLGAVGVINR